MFKTLNACPHLLPYLVIKTTPSRLVWDSACQSAWRALCRAVALSDSAGVPLVVLLAARLLDAAPCTNSDPRSMGAFGTPAGPGMHTRTEGKRIYSRHSKIGTLHHSKKLQSDLGRRTTKKTPRWFYGGFLARVFRGALPAAQGVLRGGGGGHWAGECGRVPGRDVRRRHAHHLGRRAARGRRVPQRRLRMHAEIRMSFCPDAQVSCCSS